MMTLQKDIRFLPEENLYELSVPQEAANMLGLQPGTDKTLAICHESKMKLEWLAISIGEKFDQLNSVAGRSQIQSAVKRKRALMVLGIAILIGLAAPLINKLTHFDKMYLWMAAFTIGIIACLQFLKYIAQELASKEQSPDLKADLLALRDQIDRDFQAGPAH